MEDLTDTLFDRFKGKTDTSDADKSAQNIEFFNSVLNEPKNETRLKYLRVFSDIDREFKTLTNENFKDYLDIIEQIETFKRGREVYEMLVLASKLADDFLNGQVDNTTPFELLIRYEMPDNPADVKSFVADYFIDKLGLNGDDRRKIDPVKIFELNNTMSTTEEFVEKVNELIKAKNNGDVDVVARRENFSSDKALRGIRLVNAVNRAKTLTNPADSQISTTKLLTDRISYGIYTGHVMSDEEYDTEIEIDDNGIKSLFLAVLFVFPGLLNSLLLNKKFRVKIANSNGNIDSLNSSTIEKMVMDVKGLRFNDAGDMLDTLASLFVATSYKLLVIEQNRLFSDKKFVESRLYILDMILLYFGVGLNIDGFIVGDEENVYNDRIKLENDKIIILRPTFEKVRYGLFNEYYELNKTQTGRFFHYYDTAGDWGKGHQAFEPEFWRDIMLYGVEVDSLGIKPLKKFI